MPPGGLKGPSGFLEPLQASLRSHCVFNISHWKSKSSVKKLIKLLLPRSAHAVADSGCLRGRAKNEKGTTLMLGGHLCFAFFQTWRHQGGRAAHQRSHAMCGLFPQTKQLHNTASQHKLSSQKVTKWSRIRGRSFRLNVFSSCSFTALLLETATINISCVLLISLSWLAREHCMF